MTAGKLHNVKKQTAICAC